jgi:hypothetical protein
MSSWGDSIQGKVDLCIARQLPPLMRGPLGGSQASTETRVQQMAVYQTTFEINAPATRVWHVLTDLSRYSEWNPQIPRTKGRIEEGASINLRIALPGRPAMDVSAVIEQAQPDQLLTWRGHVVAPWFFEGYRKFAIQPIESGRVTFTHIEDIHGLLAPMFTIVMGGAVSMSHRALNEALRLRAESLR